MTLRDIAILNLRRRKGKAAFILAGLLVGVTTVVTLVTLVRALSEDITHKLDHYGANILVVPKTENLSLTYGGLTLGGVSFDLEEIRQEELDRIRQIPNRGNLAAVGPMVLGLVEAGGRKALLAGVDFEAIRTLKPWWSVDGRTPREDEVLLGSEAARALGVGFADPVTLGGGAFVVSGVLEPTGSQDDGLAFVPLAVAQRLLGKEGRVSMVEVAALCMDCPIDEMVRQIAEAIPNARVMGIRQVVQSRVEALGHFRRLSLGVSAIVALVGCLVVLVTMLGSVRERTREIGIFRAIGFRSSHVTAIVLMEAAMVATVAGLVGYPLGLLATRLSLPLFTDSLHVAIPIDPVLAAGSLLAAVLLGVAASAYPALLAARLDPNEALRAL